MRAMMLTRYGGVENLELRELPVPEPGPGEVLVKVAASSVNPADVKTRAGLGAARITSISLPFVTGWDLSEPSSVARPTSRNGGRATKSSAP